jgi:hypothetical protein
MESSKICARCKIEKDINEYHKLKSSKDGYKKECKSCRSEESKQRRQKYKLREVREVKECKRCNVCKVQKKVDEYYIEKANSDGYRNSCKSCILDKNKQQRQKYKLREVREVKECKRCNVCKVEKKIDEFHNDISRKDGYSNRCKECHTEKGKEYREKNIEQLKEYYKEYYTNIKDRIIKQHNNYEKERRKVDPQYRMIRSIRKRTRRALNGASKSQTTKQLLGIDFEKFTKWIEFQLPVGYTMDDVATKKVHLDHVIPLSSFNLLDEEELQKACSWINIQPLESTKNLQKSG